MSTPQTPPARKRITLLALCLAAFIISLDVTIVNVALCPPWSARPARPPPTCSG